jgi:hypothetical protein
LVQHQAPGAERSLERFEFNAPFVTLIPEQAFCSGSFFAKNLRDSFGFRLAFGDLFAFA